MDRRGFLKSILALGAAPVFIKSENLMKLVVPSTELDLSVNAGEFLGFGLAPIKREGAILTYNAAILTASHAKDLWPGIKDYWAKVYDAKAAEQHQSDLFNFIQERKSWHKN